MICQTTRKLVRRLRPMRARGGSWKYSQPDSIKLGLKICHAYKVLVGIILCYCYEIKVSEGVESYGPLTRNTFL